MASFTASSVSFGSVSCPFKQKQVGVCFLVHFYVTCFKQKQVSNLRRASLSFNGKGLPSLRSQPPRFRVSCEAKPETVDKVCQIVRKQLALAADREVCGESKFATLGADSLDTVEIVMGLEEEFGISVEEESAQSITTVQEAADMIEKLLEKKC